jgi:sugar lactone lactonase YvrE
MRIGPASIASDKEGNLYVADPSSGSVKVFTPKGKLLRGFGTMRSPSGVAIDPTGDLFVADSYNAQVWRFSLDGKAAKSWGSQGTSEGQLRLPAGVAVDAEGHIWVADKGNQRLQKFTREGAFLLQVTASFKAPMGIATDSKGNVCVVDGTKVLRQFNVKGTSQGTVSLPAEGISIARAKSGALYVGCMDSMIYIVESSGTVGKSFPIIGPMPGGPDTIGYQGTPFGLSETDTGDIAVLDLMNFRVLIFKEVAKP